MATGPRPVCLAVVGCGSTVSVVCPWVPGASPHMPHRAWSPCPGGLGGAVGELPFFGSGFGPHPWGGPRLPFGPADRDMPMQRVFVFFLFLEVVTVYGSASPL